MGPLDFDQPLCPRCGRPSSPKDFEPARAEKRAAARRRWGRNGFALILFAACAAGAYSRRATILGLASLARGMVEREFDKASSPGQPEKPLSPEAQRLLGAITGGRAPASAETEAAPEVAVTRLAGRPPKPPAPAGSGAMRVYGVVYDLGTAAPVAGASLTFGKGGLSSQARTDSNGHYLVDIPAGSLGDGLTAVVRAGGYREGQIEEVDPPYRERSAEERLAAIAQLSPSDLAPLSVRASPRGTVLSFDIVLVPLAPR